MMFSRIQRGTDALSYRGIARFRRVSRVVAKQAGWKD
jgi:hypothetical protein